MTRILVLGAGGSAGWNFIESVKRHCYVLGVDINPDFLRLSNAHDTRVLTTKTGDHDRLDEINRLIFEHEIEFVHAQPDPEVLWLGMWAPYVDAELLLPKAEELLTAQDKQFCAEALGALAPDTFDVHAPFENEYRWLRLKNGAGSKGALKVFNSSEVRFWTNYWWREHDVPALGAWMLQEYLPGENFSWTGVYRDGLLLGSACKQRTVLVGAAQHPSRASSTASVQEIVHRPDINALCERAVSRLAPRPSGIFMFDLLQNEEGDPKITECNPGRFGTTSLFWAYAGGNLPLAYVMGEPIGRDCCREGAKWIRQPDMGQVCA